MSTRSRKKKAELLQELSEQDQQLEELRQQLRQTEVETERRIAESEVRLSEALSEPLEHEGETVEDPDADQELEQPPEASETPIRWQKLPRILAISALGLAFAALAIIFITAGEENNKSLAPVAAEEDQSGVGAQPQADNTIGPENAHRVVTVYADATSPETKNLYQDYLFHLLQRSKPSLMIFEPLDTEKENVNALITAARQEDLLWNLLNLYLQEDSPYSLDESAAQLGLHPRQDETAELEANQETADDLKIPDGGLIVRFQDRETILPLDASDSEIRQALGL